MNITGLDLEVQTLGPCRIDSPLAAAIAARRTSSHSVEESDRVLFDDIVSRAGDRGLPIADLPGFEVSRARRKIYFDPAKIRVGIVTCGGLCPGMNNVIRGIVLHLARHYGVRRIVGFRHGYQGFIPSYGHPVVELTPESVAGIDESGGTILGTSRGQQDPEEVVDCLERMNINVLLVIGGDGTMRGAIKIAAVARERGEKIAVVGIPKTIDNDIPFIDRSFGFQTAFGQASESLRAAHVEACSAPNGVGMVKLMGRESGFIACYAALARGDADYVLIPEVPFQLDGADGFLAQLRRRVLERGHAVVVLAEGAGQEHIPDAARGVDASGNLKFNDIGGFLKDRIIDDFARAGADLNIRYFDPSYAIRSVPANPYDSVFCLRLAHAAVHAAMAGRTSTVVGYYHGRQVHLPMSLVSSGRNTVDPQGNLWLSVLEATDQPPRIGALPVVEPTTGVGADPADQPAGQPAPVG